MKVRKMKELFNQIIYFIVPVITELVITNWTYLKLYLMTKTCCSDYKKCIQFEVNIYVLIYLDTLLKENSSYNKIREQIKEEIKNKISDELHINLQDVDIENRKWFYIAFINATIKKSKELEIQPPINTSIDSVFFALLKRICSVSNLNEYIELPKKYKLLPWHISEMALSNNIQSVFTATLKTSLDKFLESQKETG
jgi:hypothetical protein